MNRITKVLGWFKDELVRARFLDVAAASAMWLFLSLLPIAAVAGMLVAKIGSADRSLVESMLAAFPVATQKLLNDELARMAAWNGGAVGPFSAIVFLWLASSGFHALFDSFEVIAGCSRPWWKKRLIAIGSCVALSTWVAAAGAFVGWATRAEPVAGIVHFLSTGAVRYAVGFSIEVLLITVLFSVGVPRRGNSTVRRVVPGALLAGCIHAVLGLGYVLYVRRIGDGGAYQAGLATIGVTLMVLWLFALSLLIGLSLDKYLSLVISTDSATSARKSSFRGPRPSHPPSIAGSLAKPR